MTTEDVRFAGSTGAELAGVLHLPSGEARGSVLLVHCFTCGKDLATTSRLARGLADAGYAAFRFDFTGLGESGGDFRDATLGTDVRDVARAAATLIERGYGPCAMVGHSLGGAAVLLAASRVKTARSLAVIGAPSDPAHVRHLFAEEEGAIHAEGCQVVDIGGRPFPITDEFVHDLEGHGDGSHIAALGRPLLVMHAVDDSVVPISEGERTFSFARQPKAFVPLLDTDHLMSSRQQVAAVVGHLVDWFDATL